jgi:sporulation-control protein spo0M
VVKLNNVVVPDESTVVVKEGTGKVTVKLKKWYDSSTWRHLIDTGSNPTVDHIASAVEKAGIAAKHVDGEVTAEHARQLP